MINTTRDRPAGTDGKMADPDQSGELAGLVRECQLAGISRRACIVHLSRLGAERMRPHTVRLARAALEPLANADRARLFSLPGNDLVAVWRGAADPALQASRTAIMHLLLDEEDGSTSPAMLWQELELPSQAGVLLALAGGESATDHVASAELPGSPLDPLALSRLEAQLARADEARFVRRGSVCARTSAGGFKLRWEKRTLCIDELAECLSPEHVLRGDLWLFRRLTRTLDRRMLALLAAPAELDHAGPFAIDLNVASILAPEFLRFDAALPNALRGQVTVGLHPADILSDPASFLFARDFARARSYRMQLRGVTADLLPVFPPGRLGLDLLELRWTEQATSLDPAAIRADAAGIMLSHADTPAALEWGEAMGIALFQGKAVVPSGRPPKVANR